MCEQCWLAQGRPNIGNARVVAAVEVVADFLGVARIEEWV